MTNLTDDLNIIQALADLPNDTDGLSAAQLKAKFDEAGNTIKTFLNSTHIPEVTTALNGKTAKPAGNGTSGQYLMTNGDGTTAWNTPTGAGDMAKSVYDTDNDGKVDSAESADTAAKVGHTLTAGSKTFNGSANVTLTANDMVSLGSSSSIVPTTADDVPSNWAQYGTGFTWFEGTATVLDGMTETYGTLFQRAAGNLVHQIFLPWTYGHLYYRSGNKNNATWNSGGFKQVPWSSDLPTALSDLSGTLAVNKGGTGATTAAAARTNLGAAAASDIPTAVTQLSGTLAVGHGGTGKTTASSNALLAGNGTSALKEVATANGALYATSSGGAAAFGTLPVAQGGTGKATHTANAILAGNNSSAVKSIGTNSGALFATSNGGAASFGTLPVLQGGTGATSAAIARTNLGITPANIGAAAASDIPTTLSQLSGTLTGDKITSPAVSTAGARKIYLSTSDPTGGSNGDVWIKY